MSGGPDESLLQFPCDLPIKVFGRNDSGFREAVLKIVESYYGDAYTVAEQESKQAAYVSLTITVRAASRAEVDSLYRELVANQLVLMAL